MTRFSGSDMRRRRLSASRARGAIRHRVTRGHDPDRTAPWDTRALTSSRRVSIDHATRCFASGYPAQRRLRPLAPWVRRAEGLLIAIHSVLAAT